MLVPVILSGGSGVRLWPLSRRGYPKQFLPLLNHHTLFGETLGRCTRLDGAAPPVVVANQDHRFFVAEQMQRRGVEGGEILLEPCSRNTAPAIAAAAFRLLKTRDRQDTLMLVLPADHAIADVTAFARAVAAGREAALAGLLVTFGIVPARPETGYGYIRADRAAPPAGGAAFRVAEFVEKPDAAAAEHYFASGDFTWNSGMFLFRPEVFVEEIRNFQPEIAKHAEDSVTAAGVDMDFVRLDVEAFGACPSNSVDYAVMEHTDRAAVVPLDCGWSDVGAWSALWELGRKDAAGNAMGGDVLALDSRDSYIRSSHRLVAAVGVENLVIVETPDAVLVADRTRVQDVKQVVEQLIRAERKEAGLHRQVHRPWGTYDCIDAGERFQVKRITVNPGSQISLQKHYYRAEHWVVVRGTAEVTCDDQVITLTENQSTFIPLGSVHRLRNPGRMPLEIVEVQSGAYLGEDDIVRFDDAYGREKSGG
jgi:mannose-1-phosphate guanylyltransferase/mannose-6-phosphate isomerase